MCCSCWEKYQERFELPTPITSQIGAAVSVIADLYDHHPDGGVMHVAVDDWNLDDSAIEFCGQAATRGDDYERACYSAVSALTEPERVTALAIHEGFLNAVG